MTLARLLDPKVFVSLSTQEVDRLEAVLDEEIESNPEIQKVLRARIEKFIPHLKR